MGKESVQTVAAGTFLTVKEFAIELGLAEVTIRLWLSQRKVAFVRLGRAVRIPATEIQRLIDKGIVPAMDARRH